MALFFYQTKFFFTNERIINNIMSANLIGFSIAATFAPEAIKREEVAGYYTEGAPKNTRRCSSRMYRRIREYRKCEAIK